MHRSTHITTGGGVEFCWLTSIMAPRPSGGLDMAPVRSLNSLQDLEIYGFFRVEVFAGLA